MYHIYNIQYGIKLLIYFHLFLSQSLARTLALYLWLILPDHVCISKNAGTSISSGLKIRSYGSFGFSFHWSSQSNVISHTQDHINCNGDCKVSSIYDKTHRNCAWVFSTFTNILLIHCIPTHSYKNFVKAPGNQVYSSNTIPLSSTKTGHFTISKALRALSAEIIFKSAVWISSRSTFFCWVETTSLSTDAIWVYFLVFHVRIVIINTI